MDELRHLSAQTGDDERTAGAGNGRDHPLRKRELVPKRADFKAIKQDKDSAAFSGKPMGQAKTESY
jgi:hypothetical protein